jgi:hypothetical protein
MRTPKTLRLLIGAVVLFVAVGALWWIVGYTLGKTVLTETGGGVAFQVAYGFRDSGLSQLFFLALLAPLVRLVAADGAGRWIRLAGMAGVAAIVGGGGAQDGLSIALFVFAAAAVAEAHAMEALVVALAAGAVVALAAVLGTGLGTGQKLLVVALRDVFYYAPLLFGPELLDGLLWKGKE